MTGAGNDRKSGETLPESVEGEGFLGRWSRRKRELAAAAPASAGQAPAPASPGADTIPAEPDQRPRDPETGEPIDEQLVAALPRIEDIQPGTDLSGFMQRGVPEALRRQALRLMWESDPAIRDFVGPALDYAYDYNAPGGAPGYGPLTDADMAQARDLIARVFSDPVPPAGTPADEQVSGGGDNTSHVVAASDLIATRRSDVAPHNAQEAAVASITAESRQDAAFSRANDQGGPSTGVRRDKEERLEDDGDSIEAGMSATRRRRGGGATPI